MFCEMESGIKVAGEGTKSPPKVAGVIPRGPERGPSSSLAPTARGILDAAKRLLAERGYSGLRFDAIAAESGSNKSMIRYYFGSKAGLEAALVDDLTHDGVLQLIEMASRVMSADERVAAHLAASRVLVENPHFKCEFDILPHAMRNEELGDLMARLWGWYREVFARCFGGPEADLSNPDLLALSSVVMAAIDGLAIQLALQDPGFDRDRAWGVLEEMVKCYIERLEDSARASEDSGSSTRAAS